MIHQIEYLGDYLSSLDLNECRFQKDLNVNIHEGRMVEVVLLIDLPWIEDSTDLISNDLRRIK